MRRFILLLFCLTPLSYAKADSVATIGTLSKIMNKSTSCNYKNWENNPVYACGCCLTKQKLTSKSSSEEIVRTCIKGKYCTLSALSQWAPDQTIPDEILTTVLWSTVDTPTIEVKAGFIDKSGKIRPERFIEFLGNIRKDLRDLREPLFTDFSQPKCLEEKDLGSGGVNTAQLYLLKVNERCVAGNPQAGTLMPKYIIKETKKKAEEIRNLRQLQQSDLKKEYDLSLRNRPHNKIAISFDVLNVKYNFKNSSHYLTFLIVAPGRSFMSLSKELASSIEKGNNADIHRDSDILSKSFYSFGKGLGELHKRFMEPPKGEKLLGNSLVHGDLHLDNVYADPQKDYLITLIDNESFAKSLKEKKPVAIDLFVVYAFTVAQFKDQYAYPKEISLTMWNNLMLKPFLQGYISNWPFNQRKQLISELKKIFTNPGAIIKLLPQRSLFINPVSYRAKIKGINSVFDSISINQEEDTHDN